MLFHIFYPRAYFDHSATPPLHPKVVKRISKSLRAEYGNPSSLHRRGAYSKGLMEGARESLAKDLGCRSSQLVFTGSGTEANNLAIRGGLGAHSFGHIITTRTEHSSITATVEALEGQGCKVSWLGVDRQARYDLQDLNRLITSERTLVCLSWANNEYGTVQDAVEIVRIVKSKGAFLHLDGVQSLPTTEVNLEALGADFVSFSGHKLNGPKGIGLLYVRNPHRLAPAVTGGGQESGFRSGTENLAYILGLAKALRLNRQCLPQERKRIQILRDRVIQEVLRKIPDVILTGDPEQRLPGHASFCFKGVKGRNLVRELSFSGFEVSSGAACSSSQKKRGSVLENLGLSEDFYQGSLRITFGRGNSRRQVEKFLSLLPPLVKELRESELPDSGSQFLSPSELLEKELLSDVQILDVRPVAHPTLPVSKVHHLKWWQPEVSLSRLNRDTETVLVCYTGVLLAAEAQQLLRKKGFRNLSILRGGAEALFETHKSKFASNP